ncbi:MAG: 2-dehydropantoate 2-reductase [Burkholderiales bacterium]|nr:MAG: 2-dehydropantoate 2-reductase [Betaproteobacteria bacterium]TAG84027.1 MAG: 2-dehydropantoate 2-reductase [Burkholderiales bacterium]
MGNICVLGAGAIGGWMGAKLALAGHRVSMLARGETLRAIKHSGLCLRATSGDRYADVFVGDSAAEIARHGIQDVIIVAVKSQSLASIAPAISALLAPHTLIVSAMNGVPAWFFSRQDRPLCGTQLRSIDPDGEIFRAMPPSQVLGCVVHAACSAEAPGVIRHKFGERLILGEATGGNSARLDALAATLCEAGFEAMVSSDVQRDIWFKLWGNMTMNPISAITGATGDKILDDEWVRAFASRVMIESKAIGEAIGIAIPDSPEDRHAVTRKLGAFKTSMLQDVEAGRSIELDALVNVVREIGAHVNVPTPNIDALFGLARLFARERGLYPLASATGG